MRFLKKYTNYCILFLAFLLNVHLLHAQRGKNWYFGRNAAMRFDSSVGVTPLTNNAMTATWGVANMSDPAGNLLFYSNGNTVWNRNHQPMPNGNNLLLNQTLGSQSCMALPMPGNDSLYYLFAYSGISNSDWVYHIINMNADGGLGAVITANQPFGAGSGTTYLDGITAISDINGRDYWIVLVNGSDSRIFHSYRLSPAGISSQPVISDFSAVLAPITTGTFGHQLKPSPDGTMLLRATSNIDVQFHLMRFNSTTGQLSQLIYVIAGGQYGPVCFSPDSRRIYCRKQVPTPHICQYTVTSYTAAAIMGSAYDLPYYTTGTDMALGVNGRLYINPGDYSDHLSGITNPNDSGPQLQYLDTAVLLSPKYTSRYLPIFPNNINRLQPYLQPLVQLAGCRKYRFSFTHNLRSPATYTWQFGDGATTTDSATTHTYNFAADSVLVQLTITNTDTTLTRQQWLHLPKKPVAAFTAITQGCIKDSVHFSSTLTPQNNAPVDSIGWQISDGTFIGQQPQFSHLFADTGTYTIRLWARDTLGCRSDTALQTLAINKKIRAGFGVSGPACNNAFLRLADSSQAIHTTLSHWAYYLSNGDSAVSNLTGNLSFGLLAAGNYTLRQTATSTEGCKSDTAVKQFTVFEKPTARFGLPQNCVLDISQFTDSSTAPAGSPVTNRKWRFGDAGATPANPDSSLVQNPVHQYTQAAVYPVRLIAITQQGCADTLVKPFTINGAVPQAAFSFSTSQRFCSSDSIRVISNSTVNFGSLTRLALYWSTTDSSVAILPATGSSYTHRYPAFGLPSLQSFPLRLRVQSGINCIAEKDTILVLYAQPQVSFAAVPAICNSGEGIVLSQGSISNGALATAVYSGAGVSYLAATAQYIFTPSGFAPNSLVPVAYKATTAYGCADSALQTIRILPVPIVDAGPAKTLLEGGSTTLQASASATGLSYRWTPALELNDTTLLNPVAAATASRTYTLTVANADGCRAADSVQVTVLKSLAIPNVFSPNGDGINDTWNIPYLNTYSEAVVVLFDRYGRQVYSSKGYTVAWNGMLNGQPLPAGTYYYIIRPGNGRQPLNGSVTILR